MRRIGRWMLNGLTVLSLVLCVGTVVLWVRSYWRVDGIGHEGAESIGRWQRGQNVWSGSGVIAGEWWLRDNSQTSPATSMWAHMSWPIQTSTALQPWHHFSFASTSFDNSRLPSDGRAMPMHMTYASHLTFPYWFIVLVTLLVAAGGLRGFRWRRRGGNICKACRYDLTGNVSGVCPECGMKIATPARRSAV